MTLESSVSVTGRLSIGVRYPGTDFLHLCQLVHPTESTTLAPEVTFLPSTRDWSGKEKDPSATGLSVFLADRWIVAIRYD
jgi:hypothetical protein